jgi:acetyl esterase/lipase
VVIAHGAMDSVTSARDSRAYVQRLVRAGIDAEFHDVSRGDHAMMLNAAAWQAIVHRYVISCVSGTNR